MTQSDMANKGGRKPNRIPVRFVGDEEGKQPESGTPAENADGRRVGRQSSYEDSTEMGQRIENGEAGETGSGETGVPGSTEPSELPRSRNEQDTTVSHVEPDERGGGGASGTAQEPVRNASAGRGPAGGRADRDARGAKAGRGRA